MNRENILAVADAIEKRLDASLGFNMGDFVRAAGTAEWDDDKSGHSCGTTACIAGWTKRVRTGLPVLPTYVDDFDWVAEANWLGLSAAKYNEHTEGYRLFYAEGRSSIDEITPSQAVSVLRHLAETGEVDWDRALAEPSK